MTTMKLGRLLIVDDEPELLSALAAAAETQGYEVAAFADGRAALQVLRQSEYDLLLTDLMMPDMDGLTLLRAALEIDANLIAVMMTGHATIPTAVEAMKLGAFDYLLKPFKMAALLSVLDRAMAVRRLRLENVPLRESLAIHELCQVIMFTLDTSTVLNKLADAAMQQTEADSLAILLPTADGRELQVAAVRGSHTELAAGDRVPIESGIAGWVAQRQEPLLLQGETPDPRIATGWPRPGIRSAISYPMLAGHQLVGVVNVLRSCPRRSFTLGQMKALGILASMGAAALTAGQLIDGLRQTKQRLHHVVVSSPVVLFTLAIADNAIRGISWMSDNIKDMLGYPVEETYGADWWTTNVHPDDREAIVALVQQELFGADQVASEYRFRHRDGPYRWVRSEVRLVRNAAGTPVEAVGSWADITERKRLEDQLRQVQKMEAIGTLAGGVAHDFNNMLTIINGYSELLSSRLRPDDPLRGLVEQIGRAGNRAASLTRQLLAFSRRQVLQPQVLHLNALLTEMEKMLRRLIGEDIDLLVALHPALGHIKADPSQIEQIVMNLVVNARDAMPQGGKLTIETSNIELDEAFARTHRGAVPGPYVLLAVTDTGCGMDSATKARIFEPFFTTKGPNKGTGLGLATVYGIVKQSGGYIDVYSEPGRGATFKVYLPRTNEETHKPQPSSGPALLRGTETILVVEDEEAVRALTGAMLQEFGYQVLSAPGPEAALALLEQRAEPIHLLVSDVVMPGMSGPQLAAKLKERCRGMRVLYLSGYADEAVVHHGLIDPDTPFLQKPFTAQALARKVRAVLQGP
jgi:PAS domain S-box-containing protein